MTLQEALQGATDPRSRYAAAPQMQGAGGAAAPPGLDSEIEAQIQSLSEPEALPTLPVEKKSRLWQRILSALADAGSSWAGQPQNYTGRMLARDEQINQEIMRNSELVAGAKNRAKRTAAELKLNALLRKQAKVENAGEREQFLAGQAALKKTEREQALTDAATKTAADLAAEERRRAADISMAELKFGHDKTLAGIKSRANEGDKDSDYDKKVLFGDKGVYATIGALASSARANLAEGKTTPEELEALVDQLIEQQGLSPDGEKLARSYYKMKFSPILREIETSQMDKELDAGSPQQPNGTWDPLRALGRARAGR